MLSVIEYYVAGEAAALGARAGFFILELIAFAILVNGIVSIINLYENIREACANLGGVQKFLVLKISVGLIVIQELVISILISLNSHIP